jgi:hypothetical protein
MEKNVKKREKCLEAYSLEAKKELQDPQGTPKLRPILWRFFRPIDLLRTPPKPRKPQKMVKNRVFSRFFGCPEQNLPQKVGRPKKPEKTRKIDLESVQKGSEGDLGQVLPGRSPL